jgi:hypothetical protein
LPEQEMPGRASWGASFQPAKSGSICKEKDADGPAALRKTALPAAALTKRDVSAARKGLHCVSII